MLNVPLSAPMLEARSLTKWFGDAVAPSDVVCPLGANGAGETITMNLFLGFLEPSAGEALTPPLGLAPAGWVLLPTLAITGWAVLRLRRVLPL